MSEEQAQQNGGQDQLPPERGSSLCGWIMERVKKWRDHRDQKHRDKWDEYVRIWRGEWQPEDKNRKSERSKIVTPATMQAVDATVAEIEEAVFGREQWFDIDEDVDEADNAQQREEMIRARDHLRELFEDEKVPSACAKAFLIAALYGTAVGKINVYPKAIKRLQRYPDGTRKIISQTEARVELMALEPYEVVPDPTTDDIEMMLGIAHETIVPVHIVRQGVEDGLYRPFPVSKWTGEGNDALTQDRRLFTTDPQVTEGVKITEWHGKVPASFLVGYMDYDKPDVMALAQDVGEDDALVEAIVTIANEAWCIAAKPNPFMMGDRALISYQHDTVPGYFWGRGVPEKGYNAQKAADATLRSRIDTLALVANPMVAGDISRLPRGMNLAVWPGKFWPTTGDPSQILTPFQFGTIPPELFSHAADMERMVQTATGALDQAANYSADSGAQKTALVHSAFVKRARRTMQNIERCWLRPLIQKSMWRYVQFSPAFPQDYKFTVTGTLGVMARELETQQLTQMLSLVPNESKPFMAMVKAVFDNSSSPHKAEVIKAIDEMLNPPQDEEAQAKAKEAEELQRRGAVAQVEELEAKAAKAQAEAFRAMMQGNLFKTQGELAPHEIMNEVEKRRIDEREVAAFEHQNEISQDQLALRGMDTVIKAFQAKVALKKVENEGRKISKDG